MNSDINSIEVITFFLLFFGIALSNKQIKKNTHDSTNKHNSKFTS